MFLCFHARKYIKAHVLLYFLVNFSDYQGPIWIKFYLSKQIMLATCQNGRLKKGLWNADYTMTEKSIHSKAGQLKYFPNKLLT